jgi:hypothetical protein
MPNMLYYGDNLDILREHIPNQSIMMYPENWTVK